MAENNLLGLAKLQEYLSLVPQAAQDPAFYQIMMTGYAPDEAAHKNISGNNQLLQASAGLLQGAATIGNTFGNFIDPLARTAERVVGGPVTLGGLFPSVDQARATRDRGIQNYDALYGGSVPASIAKELGFEALGGPAMRAFGKAVPIVSQGLNRLVSTGVPGRVVANAVTGAAGAGGYAALTSSQNTQQDFSANDLVRQALAGAGLHVAIGATRGRPNNTVAAPEGFKNVVHEKPALQIGRPNARSHVSEAGYTYRTLSQKELDDAVAKGGFVPKESGKSAGGRTNVKHWVKGGTGQFFHEGAGGGLVIRVKSGKVDPSKPVRVQDVELRMPDGTFRRYKPPIEY